MTYKGITHSLLQDYQHSSHKVYDIHVIKPNPKTVKVMVGNFSSCLFGFYTKPPFPPSIPFVQTCLGYKETVLYTSFQYVHVATEKLHFVPPLP
jgi:hypothetical protein